MAQRGGGGVSRTRTGKSKKAPPEEPTAVVGPTVKSAERALMILEYFDDIQASATVMEIAASLKIPQSSTSGLLKTLSTLGYLDYDRRKRTYIPTGRVALLGSWANPDLVVGGRVVELMKDLNALTGHTILLATRQEHYIQLVYAIHGRQPNTPRVSRGVRRSVVAASSGYVLLGPVPDPEIKRLVVRYNAEKRADEPELNIDELLSIVQKARKDGYAMRSSTTRIGGTSLAVPLVGMEGRAFAICVGSTVSEEITSQKEKILKLIRSKIEEYLGTTAMAV